jgi:hypothetical protein
MPVDSDNTQVVAGRELAAVGRRPAAADAAADVAAAAGTGDANAAAVAAADFGNAVVSCEQRVAPSGCTHRAFRVARSVLSIDQRTMEPKGWQKRMVYWHQKWTQNLSAPYHSPKRAAMLAAH